MLTRLDIELNKQLKDFVRQPYAFPGAYPKVMVTADGGLICKDCAKREFRLILSETFDNSNCGFRNAGVTIAWESHGETCDHCSNEIETAYGESLS